MPNATVRANARSFPAEPVFRIAHLFRDPVMRSVFAAAERDDGAAPALPAPAPSTLTGGPARVLETA